MLRTLLADRFGLKTHRETREMPIYSLVVARKEGVLGPQLVRSTIDCEQWMAEKRPQIGAGSASAVAPGGKRPVCMTLATRLEPGRAPFEVVVIEAIQRPTPDE